MSTTRHGTMLRARLSAAQRAAERILRRQHVDSDVRELARAVVHLSEAVAFHLLDHADSKRGFTTTNHDESAAP